MARLTTYYNGACPICRREIEHYQHVMADADDGPAWCDISRQPEALTALGRDPEAVQRRLHVIDADGRLHIGVPAFAALWSTIPRYRWLAVFVGWPGVRLVAAGLYEILAMWLYRRNQRRAARARRAGT